MHAWTLLVATAIKGSLILGVAWALAARPGRWSAAARHQVLAAALAAALLLPLGTVMLPAWRWYVPGAEVLLTQAPQSARATILSMASTTPSSRTRAQEPSAAVFEARTAMSTASPRSRTIEWPLALIAFWILGTAVLSLRLTIGIVGAWRIGRKAVVVTDPSWLASREGAARRLNLTQRVEVRMTDGAMPSTCGLWRAFLLLPTDAHTWDDQRRSVVLLHEMAHIRRRDCQTQIVAQLACALYWFNPLVWIVAARLRVERELACDDLVLSAGTRSSDYATHLLDIARQFRNPVLPPVATVSMARPSQLEGRLLAILDGTRSRRQPSARRSTLGLLAAAALLLPMAAVQPAARPIDNLAGLQRVDFSAGAPGSITGELKSVAKIVGRRSIEADARQTATPAPVSQPQPSTSDQSDQQRRIVDALVTALEDENADVRQQAASTLGRMRDPRAIDGLTVALKDRDADVQAGSRLRSRRPANAGDVGPAPPRAEGRGRRRPIESGVRAGTAPRSKGCRRADGGTRRRRCRGAAECRVRARAARGPAQRRCAHRRARRCRGRRAAAGRVGLAQLRDPGRRSFRSSTRSTTLKPSPPAGGVRVERAAGSTVHRRADPGAPGSGARGAAAGRLRAEPASQ